MQRTAEETLDIASILSNSEKMEYLEGKTTADIHRDVFDALRDLPGMDPTHLEECCSKLAGYRYIDKLCDLQTGRGVRWLRKDTLNIVQGGILIRVEFEDDKVKLLCKNHRYFFRGVFDDCVVFQKLSTEEQLILLCQKNMNV